ncbi:MAG: deoxyribodipyrimidine photo-lyase [Phycisphaeraceae bacterium]|nr:MAG: deoxyribodipyrimidine photo-lyase [Phycisphaeraceae bacterium]
MRTLVWFRSDLRAGDNTALWEASRSSADGVVGLYVVSPGDWRRHEVAPARVGLILRTLAELSETLAGLNIPLRIVTAPTPGVVPGAVVEEAVRWRCGRVAWNIEYEVNEAARDEATAGLARARGLEVSTHHDQVVIPPADIRTGEGRFYTVFTPFRRAWLAAWAAVGGGGGVGVVPTPTAQRPIGVEGSAVPGSVAGFESPVGAGRWPGGERAAGRALDAFAASRIGRYKADRDYPGIEGTSGLSPYLAVGAISPRRCVHAALSAGGVEPARLDGKAFERMPAGPGHWLSEVVWREFYTHVLVGYPRVCRGRAFQPETDRLAWRDDGAGFEAWCAGRTGVPIVDAAMRQLLGTGWMHNRLRMVAAMYLTKNLFIDWRRGESWFMRNLVDGYFASNNGGWQWSASTGTDAAPYFRIFNPLSQSRTYDPDGAFIRRWVPELAKVEGDAVHDPHGAMGLAASRLDYPRPIVDLSTSRARAIGAFKALRG